MPTDNELQAATIQQSHRVSAQLTSYRSDLTVPRPRVSTEILNQGRDLLDDVTGALAQLASEVERRDVQR